MALSKSNLGSVSLDLSVWETLKKVLDKDSAKELYFQQSTSTEVDEEPAESKSSANAEDTGNLFMTGISSRFLLALIILFYSLLS